MVYTGKPSLACAECRKRKTRCDRAAPTCGQCIRAHRLCSGPRNLDDLVFINHTKIIDKKSKTLERPSTTANLKPASEALMQHEQQQLLVHHHHASNPLNSLQQPVDDLGICFFMNSLTSSTGGSTAFPQSLKTFGIHFFMNTPMNSTSPKVASKDLRCTDYYARIPDFYAREGYLYTEFHHGMQALGLVLYAKHTRQAAVLVPAKKTYIAAVRALNHALSTSDAVCTGTALMTALALAKFDVHLHTLTRERGAKNFATHLYGALSIACVLVKQKKGKKLSELHRHAMVTLTHLVALHSWLYHEPLPAEYFVVAKTQQRKGDGIFMMLEDVLVELLQFETAVSRGTLSSESLLCEITRLNELLDRYMEGIPRPNRFDTYFASSESPILVYNGYFHVYPSSFTAHRWNLLRQAQIHINMIYIQHCSQALRSPLHAQRVSLESQQAQSYNKVLCLAKEICASVPQLADYIDLLPSYASRADLSQSPNNNNNDNKMAFSIPPRSLSQTQPTNAPKLPYLSLTTSQVEHSSYMVYDADPFQSSWVARNEGSVRADGTRVPRLDSLYHIFSQLQSLRSVDFLPSGMKAWIKGRLTWIEEFAEKEDLEILVAMMERIKKRLGIGLYCATLSGNRDDEDSG